MKLKEIDCALFKFHLILWQWEKTHPKLVPHTDCETQQFTPLSRLPLLWLGWLFFIQQVAGQCHNRVWKLSHSSLREPNANPWLLSLARAWVRWRGTSVHLQEPGRRTGTHPGTQVRPNGDPPITHWCQLPLSQEELALSTFPDLVVMSFAQGLNRRCWLRWCNSYMLQLSPLSQAAWSSDHSQAEGSPRTTWAGSPVPHWRKPNNVSKDLSWFQWGTSGNFWAGKF